MVPSCETYQAHRILCAEVPPPSCASLRRIPHVSVGSGCLFLCAYLKRSPSCSETGLRPGVVLVAVLT